MNGILVDSCVLLDIFTSDPNWADWSESTLDKYDRTNTLYINTIVYTEVSIGFKRIETLEETIGELEVKVLEIPREALFLVGKAFVKYKQRQGQKRSPLPDFFIGAHAAVSELTLITRDINRYRTYLPSVNLIHPGQ